MKFAMKKPEIWLKTGIALSIALILPFSASAFWKGDNDKHPLSKFGWGSDDKRGPFGGDHGWGALDSAFDSVGIGDAMSELTTDVEWDVDVATNLKGKAHGVGKGSGEGKNKSRSRTRQDYRIQGDEYRYAPPPPRYSAYPPPAYDPYAGYSPARAPKSKSRKDYAPYPYPYPPYPAAPYGYDPRYAYPPARR